jgi:hypothetical protein
MRLLILLLGITVFPLFPLNSFADEPKKQDTLITPNTTTFQDLNFSFSLGLAFTWFDKDLKLENGTGFMAKLDFPIYRDSFASILWRGVYTENKKNDKDVSVGTYMIGLRHKHDLGVPLLPSSPLSISAGISAGMQHFAGTIPSDSGFITSLDIMASMKATQNSTISLGLAIDLVKTSANMKKGSDWTYTPSLLFSLDFEF